MATGVGSSWSPSPGTLAATQMRKEILRYVKLPNDAEALDIANDAINGAIRVLNRHVWSWTLVSTDITLVADQRAPTRPGRRCRRAPHRHRHLEVPGPGRAACRKRYLGSPLDCPLFVAAVLVPAAP